MNNKFDKLLKVYKTNKPLFNILIFFVLGILIIWQIIFTFIIPARINIFILLVLIVLFCIFFFKISGSN